MISSIRRTTQFKKDYKKMMSQGKNMDELKGVIGRLMAGESLATKYKDHSLSGDYNDCRECHIKPDWLLIYQIEGDELVLVRTGSHSELFE